MNSNQNQPSSSYSSSATSASASASAGMPPSKSRQYAHLHSQISQLNTHLADTQNLMRMTAAQAGDMRFLGGYVGGLFMGAARVLGEEGVVVDGGRKEGNKEGE